MSRNYNKAFPPPKILQLPSVGVDISDVSIKYVELGHGKTGLEILRYGEEPIPEGVVDSGSINDEKKFQEAVASFIKKVPSKFYRVSLPEERAYLFPMEIPVDAGRNPRMAIELSLEEHVPIKAPETIFDYDFFEERKGNFVVHVSAVPAKLVEMYTAPFEHAGKTVLSLELEMQATVNAAISQEEDNTTAMLVDVGLTRTSIAIVSKRSVLFSTSIDMGSQSLTSIIKRSLDISAEEAEKIKIEYGMTTDHETYADLPSVVANHVAVLRDEINKHFSYWHTHHDELTSVRPRIEKILLCGGGVNLRGLREYLSEGLTVPVSYVNPWVNVNSLEDYIPSIPKDKALSFTAAIGLALSSFEIC